MTSAVTQRLADALLADRRRETSSRHNIISCFSCGYTFLYKGRQGELNGRFCSMRCQNWYDAGNPPIAVANDTSLVGWRVIAGVEVGNDYHASVFARCAPIPMKRTTGGFKINCAHCATEFESDGLRYCSLKCESECCKPKNKRKTPPPSRIPCYVVEATGKAYWRPSRVLRRLGFKTVALGFDDTQARARALAMNAKAREAQNGQVGAVSDLQEMPILRASVCVGEAENDALANSRFRALDCRQRAPITTLRRRLVCRWRDDDADAAR
jgi:hypothetical protein